ncbi:branched-chain amino acid ABC transporter substrate-binding protein [Alicycliphilus denitrificans]|uniref:ABC transporter substrate-binding protein n=1 Tax=Alicycliphilus denitrificans TaxID=179636 RepID=UPI0019157436|nr:ABC transporter substrate-binding protein [Alicycliphilus denitrificans]BCN41092.1 branched-chain amino acid ABC transporter substrate-binding protein [Alicycliphilus denitrificans]
MPLRTRHIALLLGLAGLASFGAQAQEKIRIGFLTDMSSAYADLDGKNGAMAIQMAIDDFGGKVNGLPVELISADHQNKADIAASKAREWMDTQNISMLVGGTNSAAALAMAKLAQEKKRVFIANGPGTSALTNEQCSPYTIHYAWDTTALAKGTAGALLKQGYKNWFFLAADYAFGEALQRDATNVIKAHGGQVIGGVKHPLGAADFSSFLLQAQNSRAQILGIANGGSDMINALKASREFGIGKNMKVASLMLFLVDVHSMGLKNAEGLLFTTSWDWSLNDESRKFGRRFFEKARRMPTDVQAANYSATMQWLKAVQALKTTDADKVMDWFRKTPLKDFYAQGHVRPDGRYVHDMYLMQVKAPAESTMPWDYVKVVATMPGEEVFTTRAESRCVLWK